MKLQSFIIPVIVYTLNVCSRASRFRADVTPYIENLPEDKVFITTGNMLLKQAPNEIHLLSYGGDTAVTKIAEKPIMKPADPKSSFPLLLWRGVKKGNIPKGCKVTLNHLYVERTFMRILWKKTATYAVYADLTIHHPYQEHVFCLLKHVTKERWSSFKQLKNPATGQPLYVPLQDVLRKAPKSSPDSPVNEP